MYTIYSLKTIKNNNFYYNVNFYYYNPSSKLIPWYDIFYYYFIIIDSKIYICDFEFTHIFEFYTSTNNLNYLLKYGIYNYNNFEQINFEKAIFIKNLYTNAGHSFCNIINSIKVIYENIQNLDDYKIIITTELKNYNIFLYSIILFFFKINNIVIIKQNQLIKCNTMFMVPDFSCKIKESVLFLHKKLELFFKNEKKYKNIFLIKNNLTKNCTDGVFNIEYSNYFELLGYIFIKPENYSIIDLYNIYNNAESIIMSWGCCSYLNSTLINNNISNVIVLGNKKYHNEYSQFNNDEIINTDWFPFRCKNKYFIGDLSTEFDDEIKNKLNKIILKDLNI